MIGSTDAPPSSRTILYFRVADNHQLHAALRERNVAFVQAQHIVAKMPARDLRIAFLKDPYGNTLGMMCEVRRG